MQKKISFSSQGQRADIGTHKIYRILPNRYADAVGPFVFLDYIPPAKQVINDTDSKSGTGPHPHRGIATLTYLLSGEAEHFDSRGHHAKVSSGGAQWMKAGNGIVHDETVHPDSKTNDGLIHGFQFWINLPSKIKAEAPEYLPLPADKIPTKELSDERGWIKVIVGEHEEMKSIVPVYSKQFLYHLHLKAGQIFSMECEKGLECAAFLPSNKAMINGTAFDENEFIEFDRENGTIEIQNQGSDAVDVMLFGGERFTEPIVAKGPFVMNSELEIAEAYRDYYAGKYGVVHYPNSSSVMPVS
ncbi:MAG: pirin family protein [Bacteroidia bacterium]|nr:pirin family protein [Bacteroidia bacterium]